MEDDLNERQPQYEITSMEDALNGRQCQWKPTLMEDKLIAVQHLSLST